MLTDQHKAKIVELLTELKAVTLSRKSHTACSELIATLVEPTTPASVVEAWSAIYQMKAAGKP